MSGQGDSMRTSERAKRPTATRRRLLALALAGAFALLAFLPLGGLVPVASAHALPVRSDPAANAILQAPPTQVRMWFSEDLNPFSSKLVVVDPTNRQVDRQDSHVSSSDSREMDVSLPLLPAGTYVVAWRTQSAEDGHIAAGSFLFRIARPDGSVPPLPSTLPSGNVVGGGGVGATGSGELDGPTAFQALATWLALLSLAVWVGGVLWETWVLTPATPSMARDGSLRAAAWAASRRFQRVGRYALVLLLVANLGVVLGQTAELAGTWTGAFSPPLLRAVLFGSRFGTFWWLREATALVALLLSIFAARRGWTGWETLHEDGRERAALNGQPATAEIPSFWRELVATLRGVPGLPSRLAAGWRGRSLLGRVQLLLGLELLVAFVFSGHAAAVPASQLAYAISVDLLHLLCMALWLGGLFYIGLALVPALGTLDAGRRARVLALGLPEFSVVAIVSAAILALTGSLSATIHLTSIQQFITTSYGRVLFIKIELFLVMVAISAYHAFVLRPRLAHVLSERAQVEQAQPRATLAAAEARSGRSGGGDGISSAATTPFTGDRSPGGRDEQTEAGGGPSRVAGTLVERLEGWLRREALVGAGVLLCVALLGAFAGSLATTPTGAAAPSSGAFVQTQQAGGYAVTLKVVPATFGTNTFTVTVKDKQGNAVDGASVLIQTDMLDMDMGVQSAQLKAMGATAPGSYSGQGELTMAGHWAIIVKVLPPKAKDFVTTTFKLTAGY